VALGRAWGDLVARRLKWTLVFSKYVEARDVPTGVLAMRRDEFADAVRRRLPARMRGVEFEVDVAAQESRAFNPAAESQDILLYDPLEDRYEESGVLDLFRRLPVRMALFRIFTHDTRHQEELVRAAEEVLSAD
jgi:hypothetical protein